MFYRKPTVHVGQRARGELVDCEMTCISSSDGLTNTSILWCHSPTVPLYPQVSRRAAIDGISALQKVRSQSGGSFILAEANDEIECHTETNRLKGRRSLSNPQVFCGAQQQRSNLIRCCKHGSKEGGKSQERQRLRLESDPPSKRDDFFPPSAESSPGYKL